MSRNDTDSIRGYELKERLGQGGFGAVFRAFQPAVGREVAIKVILPEFANQPDFIRRFETEAQLIARLEHPHIVPLYDFWRDPLGAYLVMRFIRGGNLRQVLSDNPMDPEQAVTLIEQVASALEIAHRQQVIHRDVKPDNILLDDEGNAYLSDFGIAQVLKSTTSAEIADQEETLSGSLGYISPEQARGEALTRSSDLYSLGVIAFEILAGKHPFHEFSPTMQMVKHLTEPLPRIASFRADLPTAVDDVLHRATSKKPGERYETTSEFARSLRQALEGSANAPVISTPAKPQQTLTNPYKGLRAFEEADSEDFFGREALVRRLLERLETPTTLKGGPVRPADPYRFLAVVGPSGSGKSSVVKAGLAPALRRGFLPGSSRWIITQMTPGENPLEQLENELLTVASRPIHNLREQLEASPDGLNKLIPQLLPETDSEILLIIDQFEETFSASVLEKERLMFLENLRRAVTAPDSRLRVVITLRADFYDRPLMYAGFGELLQHRTEVVLPLASHEMAQAILAPAERLGVGMERGLAMEIASELTDQPGALPLLQYALTEMFERREGHLMTRSAYRSLGGVLGALTRRASEIYTALDPDQRQWAKILFQRLVTLGEGVEDTRRRVLRTELDSLSPQVKPIIEAFGKARLLSFDRDPGSRTPTIEVAHEALIREWYTLREWLNENRESIRMQRHLNQSALEWEAQDHDADDLYRGARLAQASEWAQAHATEINSLEREFLQASQAQAEMEIAEREARRQRELEAAQKLAELEKSRAEEQARAASRLRRRGHFLVAALVLAVGLLAAAVWFGNQANQQRQQAEENFLQSERLRLAAQASAMLLSGTDIDAAPLLSLESLRLGYTPEADATLQRSMTFAYPRYIFSGHTGSVFAVAFSPDSKIAATASTDHTIRLWDVATGSLIRTLLGHTNSASSLAFAPDGRTLASGSDDTTVRIWDVATGEELLSLSGNQDVVWGVAFSPDGKSIASVGYDSSLRIWDIKSARPILTIEMPTTSSSLAYSPDGKFIVTAGDDGLARLYDAQSGEFVRIFVGHSLAIISVDFSHDGRTIATGSDDKTARIWDVNTGDELVTLQGHQESVYGVDFSADDTYVLTAGYDRVAILWDRASGVQMRRFIGHQGNLYGAVISPNDQWILTGSFDATARLWPSSIPPSPFRFKHTGSVIAMTLSKDGRLLATGTSGGQGALWDTATGRQIQTLLGHEYTIESLDFSPDGRLVVTAADDGSVRTWLTSTGQQVRSIEDFKDTNWVVRFSPNGQYLLLGGDNGIGLWNAASGEKIRSYTLNKSIYAAAFSPDGKLLLAGGFEGVSLYETESGKFVARGEKDGQRSIFGVAISPDGRFAASGGSELRLMEFPSLKTLHLLQGHTGSVLSVAFSPDGTRLLSSSEDGTARVWDVSTGQLLRTFSSLQALANTATFSQDGQQVYIGGADNTVWRWDVDYQALIDFACASIHRELSAEERLKYNLPDSTPVCAKK